jgi:hypothetical protein
MAFFSIASLFSWVFAQVWVSTQQLTHAIRRPSRALSVGPPSRVEPLCQEPRGGRPEEPSSASATEAFPIAATRQGAKKNRSCQPDESWESSMARTTIHRWPVRRSPRSLASIGSGRPRLRAQNVGSHWAGGCATLLSFSGVMDLFSSSPQGRHTPGIGLGCAVRAQSQRCCPRRPDSRATLATLGARVLLILSTNALTIEWLSQPMRSGYPVEDIGVPC